MPGGRDSPLLVPEAARTVVVSVGPEPGGVPAGVAHVGGGARRLAALPDEQVRRHSRQRVPSIDEDPAWIVYQAGPGPLRRRVAESLFTLSAGGVATRGSVEEAVPGAQPLVLAAEVRYRLRRLAAARTRARAAGLRGWPSTSTTTAGS